MTLNITVLCQRVTMSKLSPVKNARCGCLHCASLCLWLFVIYDNIMVFWLSGLNVYLLCNVYSPTVTTVVPWMPNWALYYSLNDLCMQWGFDNGQWFSDGIMQLIHSTTQYFNILPHRVLLYSHMWCRIDP